MNLEIYFEKGKEFSYTVEFSVGGIFETTENSKRYKWL